MKAAEERARRAENLASGQPAAALSLVGWLKQQGLDNIADQLESVGPAAFFSPALGRRPHELAQVLGRAVELREHVVVERLGLGPQNGSRARRRTGRGDPVCPVGRRARRADGIRSRARRGWSGRHGRNVKTRGQRRAGGLKAGGGPLPPPD